MHYVDIDSLVINDRIRTAFDAAAHHELANSIAAFGLLHPPIVDKDNRLLAGERRTRAIRRLHENKIEFMCDGRPVPHNHVPVTIIQDLSDIQWLEAELAENVVRFDLSWQEKSAAIEKVYRLKRLLHGPDKVTLVECSDFKSRPVETALVETAAVVREQPSASIGRTQTVNIKEDLILASWLKSGDPEVAAAKTKKEALKIVEQKLEEGHRQALAREHRREPASSKHTLHIGDCAAIMTTLQSHTFDVILTDPPYGMGLSEFTNLQGGVAHHYDDTAAAAAAVTTAIFSQSFRLTKPKAHLYMFCDFSKWQSLRDEAELFGWTVWNRPLIWHRSDSSGMLPDSERGPRRVYECILFASKGDKRVLHVGGDVLPYPSDREQRSAARKPVPLLVDLLRRSCLPGDYVLDPCCGSGPIFPAAAAIDCLSVGIEQNEAAAGLAAERIKEIGNSLL